MPVMPNNSVWLLSGVPIDRRNKNQISFNSRAEQGAYFQSKITQTYDNVTYQIAPQGSGIYFTAPLPYDKMLSVNYCMYNNKDYNDRYFYAYIERVEWASANSTRVYLSFDPFQSWMFDYQLLPSFVEREHVASDEAGEHLINEGLEYGEYVVSDVQYLSSTVYLNAMIIVGSTVDLDNPSFPAISSGYYGAYSGLVYYGFLNMGMEIDALNLILKRLAEAGKIEAVQLMFLFPKELLPLEEGRTFYRIPDQFGPTSIEIPITSYNAIGNNKIGYYTPKNKKLLSFPYTKYTIMNRCGNAADFKYHLFSENTVEISGLVSPSAPILCQPKNYKNNLDWENAIALAPLPVCSWNSDIYSNWLAQNSASFAQKEDYAFKTLINQEQGNLVQGLASAIGTGLSPVGWVTNPGGTIADIVGTSSRTATNAVQMGFDYENTILSIAAQKTDMSVQPPQAHGHTTTTSLFVKSGAPFIGMNASIQPYYAQRLDNIFSMFGYKVDMVKIPETKSRPLWNFVKTKGCNLRSSIADVDENNLRDMYDKGFTIWHNPDIVGDYTGDNQP